MCVGISIKKAPTPDGKKVIVVQVWHGKDLQNVCVFGIFLKSLLHFSFGGPSRPWNRQSVGKDHKLLVGIYNQQFQGTFFLVFDFQGFVWVDDDLFFPAFLTSSRKTWQRLKALSLDYFGICVCLVTFFTLFHGNSPPSKPHHFGEYVWFTFSVRIKQSQKSKVWKLQKQIVPLLGLDHTTWYQVLMDQVWQKHFQLLPSDLFDSPNGGHLTPEKVT